MVRRKPKRTRLIDWFGCSAFALVGLTFLAISVFASLYGTTPKNELTVTSGAASSAERSTVTGKYGNTTDYLKFTVDGYRVSFSEEMEGYDLVLDAIQSKKEMTVGISTKRETLFPRKGWVPLYTLSIEGERVLTYEDTVTSSYRGSNAAILVGGVLLLAASLGFYRCFANRNLPRQ